MQLQLAPVFLVFDLDGTISDPAVGIGRSINYALAHFAYPSIPDTAVSQYIGPPLDASFASITGQTSTAHLVELVAKYRERYTEVGYSENVLYPGIAQALESIAAKNIPMGLCTSKRSDFAERILKMFGLRHHFQFVSGGDIGIQKKQQLAALRADQTIANNAIMIGDRAVDIEAAKFSQLKSAGVLWGHGSHAELVAAGPENLLSHPSELPDLATSAQL
ncbi:MAG: HAD family hydrolase [Burkholderiales bacterium PBB3]|nr:MAG: HAD family hydrolase [Burkholderiales bacterium PBB3]